VELETHADGDGLVLVAEQVRELGGTERLVQAVATRYPQAPLVAADFATTNVPEGHPNELLARARLIRVGRRRRHFLAPLYALRLRRVTMPEARVVLSFVHTGWAGALPAPAGARRVFYAAGLPKSLYGASETYLRDYPTLLRPLGRAALPLLRATNRRLFASTDRLLTNSQASAVALQQVYGLAADVIYPPVRTQFFTPAATPKTHFLAVARLVGHKQLELAVEAFRGLDEELVVAGGGGYLGRLRAAAPPNVRFVGFVSDEELRELYRGAHALVCPSVEEFGIVMAEAHACGVPVIARADGGALEIVEDGVTGYLVDATAEAFAAAVRRIRTRPLDPEACRRSVERFDEERFLEEIDRVLAEERALADASDSLRPAEALRGGAAAAPPAPPLPLPTPAPAPLSMTLRR
jgi:glycosyltransferase involved in cell wall biosynthesis